MLNRKPKKFRRTFHLTVLLLIASLLTACATEKKSTAVDTASIPLKDLNLVKSKIPLILLEAKEAPYAVPVDQSCASLNSLILTLDEVLAPDVDATPEETSKTKKAASGALTSTVKSLVPFRGWLRKLSGAERHSKKVAKSIAAGTIRRAFLKGIRITKQCEYVDNNQD